jgi:septum formation protein
MSGPRIVLASTSSYRRALLAKLGLPFEAAAPGVDESPLADEVPEALVLRLAQAKALAVAQQFPGSLVIGSDQVAVLGGEILGKPLSRERAVAQLQKAAGRRVEFLTGLCVTDGTTVEAELDRCAVVFRDLSAAQIERYVDRDQPLDCAGSFKSESLGIALFQRIEGEDPNALVGLPLIRLVRLLGRFGLEVL